MHEFFVFAKFEAVLLWMNSYCGSPNNVGVYLHKYYLNIKIINKQLWT